MLEVIAPLTLIVSDQEYIAEIVRLSSNTMYLVLEPSVSIFNPNFPEESFDIRSTSRKNEVYSLATNDIKNVFLKSWFPNPQGNC